MNTELRCELCGNRNIFRAPADGYYFDTHYDTEDGTTYVHMYSSNSERNLSFCMKCIYCGNESFTDRLDDRYTLPGQKMVCLKCGRNTFIEYPKELQKILCKYYEDVLAHCNTYLVYDTGLKTKLYCKCSRPRYVLATEVHYYANKRFRIMRDNAIAKMVRDYNNGKLPMPDEFSGNYDGISCYLPGE